MKKKIIGYEVDILQPQYANDVIGSRDSFREDTPESAISTAFRLWHERFPVAIPYLPDGSLNALKNGDLVQIWRDGAYPGQLCYCNIIPIREGDKD